MLPDVTTWFAYPILLALLAALPVLAMLMLDADRRRRRARALLGDSSALQKLQSTSALPGWCRSLCLFTGLALVIVASAGPRWGKMPALAAGEARPVVILWDVSRSMLAEYPSRQDLARRALRDLAHALSKAGGPRLALVIFAAHAQLAMPLTGDYDHFLDLIGHIDADDLPAALRPRGAADTASGTRIGEAIRLAIHALEAQQGGDILLLSDGDDPGGDEEWLEGAEEARRHHLPVHAIGLGNPSTAAAIPFGGGVLEYQGRPVLTRLQEKPLQEIARRSHATYVPAHTDYLPLGRLLPSILADRAPEAAESESSIPIWQPRYRWFLSPAVLLLGIPLLGRRRSPPEARRVPGAIFNKAVLVPLVVILVSAARLPDVDGLLRQGTEAFEALRTKEALALFERAEDFAPDPALVAFNEGAALYRLQRYADAALHYQRCLEDATIPAGRRAWAQFQIANALVQESHGMDRRLLESALEAYRACLLGDAPAELRADARHNLELARMFWLNTLPNPDEIRKSDEPFPMPKSNSAPPANTDKKKDNARPGPLSPAEDEQGSDDGTEPGKGGPGSNAKASRGPLTVLPDESELVPLSPEDTQAHLEQVAERIASERRHYRRHAVLVPANVKDW